MGMVGTDSTFLGEKPSPRTYGSFPRILGQFVRDEGILGLEEAIRRMTSAPAARLGLITRGTLRDGATADVVLEIANADTRTGGLWVLTEQLPGELGTSPGFVVERLAPGARSSLHHRHARQDEFIYVLEGAPVLVTDAGETPLSPGMCAGFPAGGGAHQLINRTAVDVVYLEVGDRTAGDEAFYPRDDIKAVLVERKWVFTHKDGRPY